jgi:hypothetical protein
MQSLKKFCLNIDELKPDHMEDLIAKGKIDSSKHFFKDLNAVEKRLYETEERNYFAESYNT